MCTSPITDSACFEINYGCKNCETCTENDRCDMILEDRIHDKEDEDE